MMIRIMNGKVAEQRFNKIYQFVHVEKRFKEQFR